MFLLNVIKPKKNYEFLNILKLHVSRSFLCLFFIFIYIFFLAAFIAGPQALTQFLS